MKKRITECILILMLLSPLVWINNRDSHDWGDDFAGYLREAKNISEGKPYYLSKFEYHDYNVVYAPPYYSYGFPLLLAPIVKIWGLDFKVLDAYMGLWMLAWAVLISIFLRKYFSAFISTIFILIFFYNPYFFDLKTNVISDIPFSFFFLLSLVLHQSRSDRPIYYPILTGFVFSFTVGIRGIGFVLFLIVALDFVISFLQFLTGTLSKEELKKSVLANGTIVISGIIFILLFGKVLFPSPIDLTGHFLQLFSYDDHWKMVLKNLDVYTGEFSNLFHHEVGEYSFIVPYTAAIMLVLSVIGFINSIFSERRSAISVLVLYCIVILIYPVHNQGFRFLLPVLPFIMLCIITGARSISFSRVYSRALLAVLFTVIVLWQYDKDMHILRENQHNAIWPGPFTDDNNKAFDYVKANVANDAVIACRKPRALELLADKRTCMIPAGDTVANVSGQLNTVHPSYLLSFQDFGPQVDELAAFGKDSLIWQNNAARLYLCTRH